MIRYFEIQKQEPAGIEMPKESFEKFGKVRPKFVYVVFRTMKAMDMALKVYNVSLLDKFQIFYKKSFPCLFRLISKFYQHQECSSVTNFKKKLALKLKHDDNSQGDSEHSIQVVNAGLPDEINWENIKIG